MGNMTIDAPQRVGTPARTVDLTGKIFPWKDGQALLLRMPGSPSWYLPCFSSKDALVCVLEQARVSYESIKRIDDGHEFLSSIPGDVVVIMDPHFLANGRVRFA